MFSNYTPAQVKASIKQILSLQTEAQGGKYLGLPTYVGRSKRKCFEYLRERISMKINGWQEKLLSKAGKEILIKAVAQALPTYTMACFDITKGLCDDISRLICRYWWSQHDRDRAMHWVSWEWMMLPKREGGLGFRDLHSFNMAMLARQGWRLLQVPDSLCARVLKAKYFPGLDILHATTVPGMSYVWRSILKGVQLLKEGIIWRVGNGESIRIWHDPWLPRGTTRAPNSHQGRHILTKVSELIDQETMSWDTELVNQTFSAEDAKVILNIPSVMILMIIWHGTTMPRAFSP